jgi:tetratricopeptide (TPR) repeat protein
MFSLVWRARHRQKEMPGMCWKFIRSLLIAAACSIAAPLGASDTASRDSKASSTIAAVAAFEEDAASGEPPAPLPEEASDDAASAEPAPAEPASDESTADAAPGDTSAEAMPEDSEPVIDTSVVSGGAKAAEEIDEDAKLPPAPEVEDETIAPPPPGGTLLDKIKKASTPVARPQPADFHGLRVGESTSKEIDQALGKPLSVVQQKDVERRTYRVDGSARVEVRCLQDTVQAIVVSYDPHPRWSELATELGMATVAPADVVDEIGEMVGIALPEKGVLVVYAPGAKDRVAELVYERVDAQAFTLRAEQNMEKDDTTCQQDLDMALVIDPQCSRAHWLRARLLRDIGQSDAATKACDMAVKLDPRNPRYRLTSGALLADVGQHTKAIDQTKQALALSAARPELKACCLNQMGEELSTGPSRDYKAALPMHMQAIKFAEPLVNDRHPTVRRLAQESLIVAHLSAARNIAWGNWKMKKTMVPNWLNRADELANEFAANKDANVDMRLPVCREALTACVGMEGDLDPTPWVEKTIAISAPALSEAKDPLRHRQLEWDIGTALYDALQVFHTAGDAEQAMKYGMLAVEHLEAGSEGRQLEPVEAYLLGRLYFRMGSVCALYMKDPQEAVAWFERAIPQLERPVPTAALTDTGRHGEGFVSMAVSYWAVGSHEEAVRLTRNGLKLMERAVKDGTLDQAALRVPYTNLATMHRFLGDDEQADAFTEMAAKPSDTQRK